MRAIRFEQFGSPSVLQLQEQELPSLQPGEVLVQIYAAGVNPSDAKNVLGKMLGTTLPRTPGRDFAGVVVAGAENLVGIEVWGTGGDIGFTRDGSHAEYIILPLEAVRPKPKALSIEQAGAIGVTYVTAWLCLIDAAQLTAGETLVVIGATGGVGSAAVQIAKWKGAKVIGTIRREASRQRVQQSGVDVVINLESEELTQAVKVATDNQGANVILDTVGGPMFEPGLEALSHKGRLIEISAPKESRVSFDLRDFYHRESRLFGVDSRVLDAVACASILSLLTPGFESQSLTPSPGLDSYALEDAVKAYEQVLDRSTPNKVVLIPKQ